MSPTQSRFLILAIVLLLPLAFWWGRSSGPTGSTDESVGAADEAATPSLWTCSMHPQIQLPENRQRQPHIEGFGDGMNFPV